MISNLIVGLTALLLLAGCCDDGDVACAQKVKEEQQQREAPHLLAVQDGVRLYCYQCWKAYPIYFTTPCGDVHWNEHHGKATTTQQEVNGTGCNQ
jgi:hypothetical protein